jgi:hypothetical protein
MPHELHGNARRNARPRQHAAERVAQSVEVHDTAQIITDSNAAGFEIVAEFLGSRHPMVEDPAACSATCRAECAQSLGKRWHQWNQSAFLVLCGRRADIDERLWRVQMNVAPHQLLHFPATQTRERRKEIGQPVFSALADECFNFRLAQGSPFPPLLSFGFRL